jgi:hypothetical protein
MKNVSASSLKIAAKFAASAAAAAASEMRCENGDVKEITVELTVHRFFRRRISQR